MSAAAEGCRELEDGSVHCPPLIIDAWKATTLDLQEQVTDLEEELAKASAGLERCEGEVRLLQAELDQPQAPAWRPILPLTVLGLGIAGGGCLADERCPAAVGWTVGGIAILWALIGG